jgi:hypothetical protein
MVAGVTWWSRIPDMQPHELTTDEIRDRVAHHVDTMIRYWARLPAGRNPGDKGDVEWRLEGLTHSIFAMLDGCTIDIPGFIVAPLPSKDDRAFHEENGENWWPCNDADSIAADIGGSLRYWRSRRLAR